MYAQQKYMLRNQTKKIEAGTYGQTKKPGDSTSHKSFTDRCFLPDLTELGVGLLRGTWLKFYRFLTGNFIYHHFKDDEFSHLEF